MIWKYNLNNKCVDSRSTKIISMKVWNPWSNSCYCSVILTCFYNDLTSLTQIIPCMWLKSQAPQLGVFSLRVTTFDFFFFTLKNQRNVQNITAFVSVTRFKSWKETYSTSRFLIVFPDPKTSATRDTIGS